MSLQRFREGQSKYKLGLPLQQAWAELSEKLSDVIDPAIKYGGGQEDIKQVLGDLSLKIAELEAVESRLLKLQSRVKVVLSDLKDEIRDSIMTEMESVKTDLSMEKARLLETLRNEIKKVEKT